MEQFCALIMVAVTQICACVKPMELYTKKSQMYCVTILSIIKKIVASDEQDWLEWEGGPGHYCFSLWAILFK